MVSCQRHYKDTFWKQFTTQFGSLYSFTGCQRHYKDTFWKQFTTGYLSNPYFRELSAPLQRYILKAIHNSFYSSQSSSLLSAPLQRYILKAIHNAERWGAIGVTAVSATTKIHFESNSQLILFFPIIQFAVSATTKIHFESNSQRGKVGCHWGDSCQRHYKDTFWKQFTTHICF